jgi:hypothetical protein
MSRRLLVKSNIIYNSKDVPLLLSITSSKTKRNVSNTDNKGSVALKLFINSSNYISNYKATTNTLNKLYNF